MWKGRGLGGVACAFRVFSRASFPSFEGFRCGRIKGYESSEDPGGQEPTAHDRGDLGWEMGFFAKSLRGS